MKIISIALGALLACAVLGTPAAVPLQRAFETPHEAALALHHAARVSDIEELRGVLGRGSAMLVESGDDAEDELARDRFLAAYAQGARVEKTADDSATLFIGEPPRRFPIPIVKIAGLWRFEAGAAADELVARRFARNENAALEALQAYVEAQRAYAQEAHDGLGPGIYAQRVDSGAGRHDGLYWAPTVDEARSPLALALAVAGIEDEAVPPLPHHGYFFRILRAQGPHAPGGAAEYVREGRMSGGFALLAYPARYRASGVRTFIVSRDGIVYGKDLGSRTERAARDMRAFDPDRTWRREQDSAAAR
jgi:hypothetical protein